MHNMQLELETYNLYILSIFDIDRLLVQSTV